MSVRRQWIASSAIVAVLVTGVRLFVSHGRDVYSIWPDEPAQLAIARFVGGGARWNMYNHSVWRPLFATLLAPVYWFTDDPVTVFHSALALNAILGGVAAALLVVLARRLTPLGPWWCAAVAAVISLAPATLYTTDFVFSESLLVVVYLATVIMLLRFQSVPNLSDGLGAALLAGAAFGTHSRMLPLSLIVIGAAVLAAVRHRLAWRAAVAVGLVAIAAVYSMSVYTSYLVDRLWNEPSTRNSADGVAGQLTNPAAIFVSLIGQSWSLLVATLGIVGYGIAALVRSARSDGGGGRCEVPTRPDARLVLVVFGACAALSVVFMADRWRSDQLVYGRYNAAVVGPVLIVGLAALMDRNRVGRLTVAMTGATMAVSGALLWALRRHELSQSNGLEPMILGLQPFITSPASIDVVRITVWALVWTLGLGAAALLSGRFGLDRRAAVVTVVAALCIVGSMRTRSTIDRLWKSSADVGVVATLRDEYLVDGAGADFSLPAGSDATMRMMLYQYYLPRTPFTVVDDPMADSASRYVFAPTDSAELRASGARLVWTDPRQPLGLWVRSLTSGASRQRP